MTGESKDTIQELLKRACELVEDEKTCSYAELVMRLRDAQQAFHEAVAERFAPALNSHLGGLPSDRHTEKQAIARDVNADLRSLGLAIACPKTGKPAVLLASPGHEPSKGRFQIGLIDALATNRARHSSSVALPVLSLRPRAYGSQTSCGQWTNRIEADPEKSKRR